MESGPVKFMFSIPLIVCGVLVVAAVAIAQHREPSGQELNNRYIMEKLRSDATSCYQPWERCKDNCLSVPGAAPEAKANCVAVCNAEYAVCVQN
jgi:hypothetical protein